MGYHTDFGGGFSLSRPATEKEMAYINDFNDVRHMKRDVAKLMETYNGKFGHPTPKSDDPKDIYGNEGEYFVGGEKGGYSDPTIIDYNRPPGQSLKWDWDKDKELVEKGLCVPGLWCQWYLSDEEVLEWDGGEKFYEYIPWLKYLINHFFEPWGIKLNGEVEWWGEDPDDRGKIVVKDNVVKVLHGKITFEEE